MCKQTCSAMVMETLCSAMDWQVILLGSLSRWSIEVDFVGGSFFKEVEGTLKLCRKQH